MFESHHRPNEKLPFGGAFHLAERVDSNPRTVARHLISSQGRYDHFDTAPNRPT